SPCVWRAGSSSSLPTSSRSTPARFASRRPSPKSRRRRRKPATARHCLASASVGCDACPAIGDQPSPRSEQKRSATMAFPPQRIVCLTEETVETLYLIGEQSRIVGVSGYAVRPPQVRREKPRVSAFITADIRKILALEPD